MKWLKDLFHKEKLKERSQETDREDVQLTTQTGSQQEPLAPVVFVHEQPKEGAWMETKTNDGDTVYLHLQSYPITLGSDNSCDVVLDERFIGSDKLACQHARLEVWQNRWVIIPLSQDAKVFVNGKRTGENVLKDGSKLTLGENGVQFTFRSKLVKR